MAELSWACAARHMAPKVQVKAAGAVDRKFSYNFVDLRFVRFWTILRGPRPKSSKPSVLRAEILVPGQFGHTLKLLFSSEALNDKVIASYWCILRHCWHWCPCWTMLEYQTLHLNPLGGNG